MIISNRIVTLISSVFLASSAYAATGDFGKIDANADGKITLEEGLALHPDWTSSAFKSLDTNADGFLNQQEYETALTTAPAENNTTVTPSTTAATSNQTAANSTGGSAVYLDTVAPNDVLASSLIGMRVYAVDTTIDTSKAYPADTRKDWSDVGEINDVVLDWDGSVKAVVLGVGGFLGIGEKDVAIALPSLQKVRESADSNDWFLVVNSSKELLTNAPAYTRKAKS
jgi:PRC-barrel domain/EF hand